MPTTRDMISEEEYLLREPEADYKSEFRDGRVVAMAGASPAHSLLTANLIREIGWQLKRRPCRVYSSDTRIKVVAARFYTYPDLSIVCEDPLFDRRDSSALLNPALLVEVLSPATEAYDRGQKFKFYQQIDSLREYVLVAQDRICIECFRRQADGRWTSVLYETPEDSVDLPSIGCRVAVCDVYDKVDIP